MQLIALFQEYPNENDHAECVSALDFDALRSRILLSF